MHEQACNLLLRVACYLTRTKSNWMDRAACCMRQGLLRIPIVLIICASAF